MNPERWLARHAQSLSILMPDPPAPRAVAPIPVQPDPLPDPEPVVFEALPEQSEHLPEQPALSEESLCIADAGDAFVDPPCEPISEIPPVAPAAWIGSAPVKLMLARCPASGPSRRRARAERRPLDPNAISSTDPRARGLLYFKKWWFLRRVGISVRGTMLDGTPIFLRDDALRVINEKHSYIIPIRNVDYIRTPDGLDAACEHFECRHAPRDPRGHA